MLLPHHLLLYNFSLKFKQLQSGGKKLKLVIPDCLPCELMLEIVSHLLEPGKIDRFYDCT